MGLGLALAHSLLSRTAWHPIPIEGDATDQASSTPPEGNDSVEEGYRAPVGKLLPNPDSPAGAIEQLISLSQLVTEVFEPGTDGERKEIGMLRDGKRVGVWRIYDNTGALWMEHNYVDGALDGVVTIRNDDGSKWLERNYRMGKLHGVETGWYSDGTISFRQHYDDGSLNGEWETNYPNGLMKARGTYHHGKFSGFCEFFLPDGSVDLDKTGKYEFGQRVE